MEKQISIIIPTYNMEAYIGKCLDSLLIPEFDAVEVLVVNDGSKDRSSEIAHSYADRYPGSIRVIDKPNGNSGSMTSQRTIRFSENCMSWMPPRESFRTVTSRCIIWHTLKKYLIDSDTSRLKASAILTTSGQSCRYLIAAQLFF